MRANAENFNIDSDNITIAGTSAGGHLASLVGLTNGLEMFETLQWMFGKRFYN